MFPTGNLTLLKLGGSLITDKNQPEMPRPEQLQALARQIRAALDAQPELNLVIGHGSGSFGHVAGKRYHTRDGVRDRADWRGYAEVSAAAARLNRLVTDSLLAAGVPVLSLQPSASARCRDGRLESMALAPIRTALANGLVPLVYGDVALDDTRGGTIISTEEIFGYLTPHLKPERILLVGEVSGVLDENDKVLAQIRPAEWQAIAAQLGGSHGVDVTGGMTSKVHEMLALVAAHPNLSVRIFSGLEADSVERTLLDPSYPAGTLLTH